MCKCLCFPSFLGCLDYSVRKRNLKRKSLRETRNVALLFFLTRIVWTSRVVLVVNNPPANAGDIRDLITDSGRSAGGGHGNLLQYSYPKNPIDRGAWWATVHGVTKSRTRLMQLHTHALELFINRRLITK